MHKEIKAETIETLQTLGKALGGTGEIKSIIPVRICDHCQDEDQEAHTYGVHDANGNYWHHLCNECYDALGCSYPQDDDGRCEVDEGEALPLARPGYQRVLVTEFTGMQHCCFVPAEFVGLHRSHGDLVKAINYIRNQAPGLTMRKVEML